MQYRVAIVGATGAVGQEFLKLLESEKFPVKELILLASASSAGKEIKFKDKKIKVLHLTEESFKDVDLAFFSANTVVSLHFAKIAAEAGALVIDNSSAFRMDPNVPLVVPECNFKSVTKQNRIIANPNCSTVQLVMTLYPLLKLAEIEQVRVATYQAVSGAGAKAVDELEEQIKNYKPGIAPEHKVFPAPILNNLIPHIDQFTDNHYTKEEIKMVNETRKILARPNIAISTTCVRVPVFRSHSAAVWLKFSSELKLPDVIKAWEDAPGVKVINEDGSAGYPMPYFTSKHYETYVGRIRLDLAEPKGIVYWSVSDQLLKGAALNAIQIAQHYFNLKSE